MSGQIYLWGDDSLGQLGVVLAGGATVSATKVTPTTALSANGNPPLPSSWKKIVTGGYHTIALANDGTLWGWGDNSPSLGYPANPKILVNPIFQPSYIGNNIDTIANSTAYGNFAITDIAAGLYHTLILNQDGRLFGFGDSTYGQRTPTSWSIGGPRIIKISAGSFHNIAIDEFGMTYVWGRNNYGQLGNSGTSTGSTFFASWGINRVIDCSAGDYHTCIIRDDNRLFTTGLNNNGQLGIGTTTNKNSFYSNRFDEVVHPLNNAWAKVSAGTQFTIAIDISGDLYAWGYNAYGQLGVGDTVRKLVPTLVPRQNNRPWVEVSAGNNYTLAINDLGELYAWGQNNYKQIGVSSNISISTVPVKIGEIDLTNKWTAPSASPGYHSAAIFGSSVEVTTTTTTSAPLGITSYKFNNVSIPLSQVFRTDTYRTLFPNFRPISSVNDIKVTANTSNSIELTFSSDVLSLSVSNLKLIVHTKPSDTCASSTWALINASITKVSDRIYIINGLDTTLAATLFVNTSISIGGMSSNDILLSTNDTILIPIAPTSVDNNDNVYSCYRDYITSTTTTTSGPTTTTTAAPTTTTTTTTTTVRPQIIGNCYSRSSFSRIQLRRGTDAQFSSFNTVLASGEPGYATDTRVIKVGDGYTTWANLLPVNISGTVNFPTILSSNGINVSSVGNTYVIGATGLAQANHTHLSSHITDLSGVIQAALSANTIPTGTYAPFVHQHTISDITNFNPSGHKHVVADIQGLDLNNLPVAPHSHTVNDITDISSYYAPISHNHNPSDIPNVYRTNIHDNEYYDYGYGDLGYIYISWATNKQIQRIGLAGSPVMIYKNAGWPGMYDYNTSVDVLLELSVSFETSADWTSIVNSWYSSPPEPLAAGTHLVLLRAMGPTIDGHYIGNK